MSRKLKAMMLVAAVATVVAFVLPSTALAATKASTRIYGLKTSFVVNNSNPSTTAASPVATGKLQKYYGGRWVSMAGTVKLYKYNDATGGYAYIRSAYAGSGAYFKLSLPSRGRYKVAYAGNTTTKPTYKYTVRYDRIVSAVETATVTITDIGGGKSTVRVSQPIAWNETAYPGLEAAVSNWLLFYDEAAGYDTDLLPLLSLRTVKRPGTYDVQWTVDTADLLPDYEVAGDISFDDPYIMDASYGQEL